VGRQTWKNTSFTACDLYAVVVGFEKMVATGETLLTLVVAESV
jgi:hypothetical protein